MYKNLTLTHPSLSKQRWNLCPICISDKDTHLVYRNWHHALIKFLQLDALITFMTETITGTCSVLKELHLCLHWTAHINYADFHCISFPILPLIDWGLRSLWKVMGHMHLVTRLLLPYCFPPESWKPHYESQEALRKSLNQLKESLHTSNLLCLLYLTFYFLPYHLTWFLRFHWGLRVVSFWVTHVFLCIQFSLMFLA